MYFSDSLSWWDWLKSHFSDFKKHVNQYLDEWLGRCNWDDSFSQLHVAHQMAFKTPCNRCYVDTIGRHNVSHLTCVMSTQCVVLDMAFFYKLHVTCRTWEGLYRTPPNRCYVDRLCRTLHVAHEMAFTGYVLNVAHQMAFTELPPMCVV